MPSQTLWTLAEIVLPLQQFMTPFKDSLHCLRRKPAMERQAILSFAFFILCLVLSLGIVFLELDRLTISLLNWLVFIPASLIALYNSILVVRDFERTPSRSKVVFLIMALPVILLYILLIGKLMIG